MKYLLLALAWTAYCTLHSAMISETGTGFLKRRLGDSFRFYRLFFNTVAMLTLVPVLWYSHSLSQLIHEFGDAYRSYQGRVSMFVPLKWTRLRIAS